MQEKPEPLDSSSGLVSIKKTSVRTLIFDQIKEKITSGEWKPGTKLPPEKELIRILNVSRFSLREAFQKLIALGLLETHQGGGTYVKKPELSLFSSEVFPFLSLYKTGILEILKFRRIVEMGAIELAIMNAKDADILWLEDTITKMCNAEADPLEHALEDFYFHRKIIELSESVVLTSFYDSVKKAIIESIKNMVTTQGNINTSKYHTLILQDFKNRDVVSGRQHAYEHLCMGLNRLSRDKNIKIP